MLEISYRSVSIRENILCIIAQNMITCTGTAFLAPFCFLQPKIKGPPLCHNYRLMAGAPLGPWVLFYHHTPRPPPFLDHLRSAYISNTIMLNIFFIEILGGPMAWGARSTCHLCPHLNPALP